MTKTLILGAGPVGRVVASVFSDASLVERQTLPNYKEGFARSREYGPVYVRSRLPGFKLREVGVLNHIDGEPATDETAAAYRAKTRGDQYEGGTGDQRNWYHLFPMRAVQYLIDEWPDTLSRTEFAINVLTIDLVNKTLVLDYGDTQLGARDLIHWDTLISTIPMPEFWRLVYGDAREDHWFRYKPVHMFENYQGFYERRMRHYLELSPQDIYCNYISDPARPEYRETWRDGVIHVETHERSLAVFGDAEPTISLYPGKIWTALSEDPRRYAHMFPLSNPQAMMERYLYEEVAAKHGVYFAGRYGAWRQEETLHDTYDAMLRLRELLNKETTDHGH